MPFLRIFVPAFYSAALYRALRDRAVGYGLRYSFLLFGFIAVISTTVVMLRMPEKMQAIMPELTGASPVTYAVILLVAVLLRGAMLFTLAVAARLIALRLKTPMGYDTAFRITGAAYTPVAVADAVIFCLEGQTMNPLVLFVAGVIMLVAVLTSIRGA